MLTLLALHVGKEGLGTWNILDYSEYRDVNLRLIQVVAMKPSRRAPKREYDFCFQTSVQLLQKQFDQQ